ncbi:MAG: hypothetical protein ACXWID_06355 [Pyrinomonadaceae bacterium]
MKTNSSAINVDARYQTIFIIWMAILMTVVLYLFLIWMTPKPPDPEKSSLAIVLSALSVVPVAISFYVKSTILARARETQDLPQVQQGYVTGFALSEIAVLLGVLIHFVTGSPYTFVAIAIGTTSLLLHFPRKQHLIDATFKPL